MRSSGTSRAQRDRSIGERYAIRREKVHYSDRDGMYQGRTISYLSRGARVSVFVPEGSSLLSRVSLG